VPFDFDGGIKACRGHARIDALGASAPRVCRPAGSWELVRYSVIAPQGREEFPLPPLDVVFGDGGTQNLVASASFLKRHCERLRDRGGDRFRIIGIDQQGTSEFDRGAGEAR
jgi:hypothetical protein